MDDEDGLVLPSGPRYTELMHVNRQLELFVANGPARNFYYDDTPPPSRNSTLSYVSDEERNGGTPEQLQSLRMVGEVYTRRLKEDPYYGLSPEQRTRAIEEGRCLTEEARKRKEAEKRRNDQWWASRDYTAKSIFAFSGSARRRSSAHQSNSPPAGPDRKVTNRSTRAIAQNSRSSPQDKEPSKNPVLRQDEIGQSLQEDNKRRSKRLAGQPPSQHESLGPRRSKRLAERAYKEALERQRPPQIPPHIVSKPLPVRRRRRRGLRR